MVGVMIIGRVWKRGTISKTFQFPSVNILLCNAFPPVLSPRIHTYLQSTRPIIDLYERMGKVRKVDASKSVDEVSVSAKKAMGMTAVHIFGIFLRCVVSVLIQH